MTREEFNKRLSEVECLREFTVYDVIMSEDFFAALTSRLDQQKALRKATFEAVRSRGKGRAFAHTVDKFLDSTTEQFRDDYLLVLNKTSKRSAAERLYIKQLGDLAYNDAVEKIAVAECPELEEGFKKFNRNNGFRS